MSAIERDVDAVVIGAGFAGLYAVYKLRELGLDLQGFEAADGVGGTWRWNCYPGCRCDVASMEYSYSFDKELEQEWTWKERYGAQEEILAYLEHVADRHDLRRHFRFETRVTSAVWDDDAERWVVETDRGDRVRARFLIAASGNLSLPNTPPFPGIDRFRGRVVHTGTWPREGVDVSGRRVGVIGTGSSGVQVIPMLAQDAEHLYVFQRTPHFVVPAANHPLSEEYVRETKARYDEFRRECWQTPFGFRLEVNPKSALEVSEEERNAEYQRRWDLGGPELLGAFSDIMLDERANETCAQWVRDKIAEIVDDPETARRLQPTTYPIGAKRLVQGTGYYETYNRDNVTLVDLLEAPIVEITERGVRTEAAEYELDVLVLATGYDGVTGPLLALNPVGRDGLTLREAWADGPHTYLGLGVAGFPNLITVTGPGSPSVVSNFALSIEQHVDWIADLLAHMREHGIRTVEPDPEAQEAWTRHVREVAEPTLFTRANSWWMGANIPGKPRVFLAYLGGVTPYKERCDEVAANGYEGFVLTAAEPSPA
ncbi:MAG: NAD(P)/FAD-dependent oxidoreductase [Solirubrobacteraceae bacterium]|nr:NAD(P)/FAD-dependent oxidoreductase [Solirubrobacteraceae bacterium]